VPGPRGRWRRASATTLQSPPRIAAGPCAT
jgi:hypothetical protein